MSPFAAQSVHTKSTAVTITSSVSTPLTKSNQQVTSPAKQSQPLLKRTAWVKRRVSFMELDHVDVPTQISSPQQVESTTSQTKSFISQRELQVKEMIAGKKLPPIKPSPWPEPLPSTMELWIQRHPAYSFTKRYMDSQKRFLFLADIDPNDRFEQFEMMCFLKQLAPTTAESYWTTWLGVQKAIGVRPCEADARVTKILKARSAAYPVNFPKAMSFEDLQTFIETFKDHFPSITAVVALAFLNGQRISDAIQIAAADIDWENHSEFVKITVRFFKTMSTSQPYTLWIRRDKYPAEDVIQTALAAKSRNRLFLLSDLNSDEERSKILSTIREMIISVNDELELRSIRRGGLQRMANLGFPLKTIREFSQHVDDDMLMRYLGWGTFNVHRKSEMTEVIDAMQKHLMTDSTIASLQ